MYFLSLGLALAAWYMFLKLLLNFPVRIKTYSVACGQAWYGEGYAVAVCVYLG